MADNVNAKMNGRSLKKFRYKPPYQMAVIGKRRGVAMVYGIRIQGVAAWMLWRTVFPYKMPGSGKRPRAIIDRTEDLLFERNIARFAFIKRKGIKEYKGEYSQSPIQRQIHA